MKVWFFVETIGGPEGTMVVVLTSIGDHREMKWLSVWSEKEGLRNGKAQKRG